MLKGKTAIVTGGSKGIGLAIAKGLKSQGAKVVICSRTKSQLKQTVRDLAILGMVADISRFEDCKALIEFAHKKTGRVDILVNNAGIYGPVGFLETNSTKEWKKVLEINVLGAIYCSKLVIPYMKKQGSGKIVNLAGAGVGGPKPLPRFSGYYVSKAAIIALTENLGAELMSDNIQVNAIAPGGVASDLNMNLLNFDKDILGEDMYQMLRELKKTGGTPPGLAAKMVSFLASENSNHITGRLLSAKWDSIEELKNKERLTPNMYRLRRVDNKIVKESKK